MYQLICRTDASGFPNPLPLKVSGQLSPFHSYPRYWPRKTMHQQCNLLLDVVDTQSTKKATRTTQADEWNRALGLAKEKHRRGKVRLLADEDSDISLAVNLDSIFHLCRALIPLMIETGGGAIANTASQRVNVTVPVAR